MRNIVNHLSVINNAWIELALNPFLSNPAPLLLSIFDNRLLTVVVTYDNLFFTKKLYAFHQNIVYLVTLSSHINNQLSYIATYRIF